MTNRKFIVLTVFLLSIIIILIFYVFLDSASVLSLTGYFIPVKTEDTMSSTVNSLIVGENKLSFDVTEGNTCYWIKSTMKKGKHFLEINEYENSNETRGCSGILKNTELLQVDHPVNIQGMDCICGDDPYHFEWVSERQLRITKLPSYVKTVEESM